jgi:hypothetical protein
MEGVPHGGTLPMGRAAGKGEKNVDELLQQTRIEGTGAVGRRFVGEVRSGAGRDGGSHPPQLFSSQSRGRGCHPAETATHVMASWRARTQQTDARHLGNRRAPEATNEKPLHAETRRFQSSKLLPLWGPGFCGVQAQEHPQKRTVFNRPLPANAPVWTRFRPSADDENVWTRTPCRHASLGLEMHQLTDLTGADRR